MGLYSATTEGERASTTSAKTILALIGSATRKAKLVEWGISFSGVSATGEPVRVRMIRATADGTGTAATENPWEPDDPATPLVSAKYNYSAEPTKASVPLAEYLVHPQAGIVIQYPLGREIVIDNATGSILCIEVLAPATVDCVAYVVWEE